MAQHARDVAAYRALPDTAAAGEAAPANGADSAERMSHGDARHRAQGDGSVPGILADWQSAVNAKRAPFAMVAAAHDALRGLEPDQQMSAAASQYFGELYEAFAHSCGTVVQLHWPSRIHGGLALTALHKKPSKLISRFWQRRHNADRDLYDLHAVYEHHGPPELLRLAWELDKMLIDTRLFIRGAPQRSAVDTVFSCYVDVITALEEATSTDAPVMATDARETKGGAGKAGKAHWPELAQAVADARHLVDELAQRQAEGRYLAGGVAGLLLTLGIVLPLVMLLGDVHFGGLSFQTLLGAMLAGATGAILSVLLRTGRGSLGVRWRVGRLMTFLLGTFRPLVGAICGGIGYLLLETQLVSFVAPLNQKSEAFYWAVGVLAGFSERFVPDMLTRSASSLQPASAKTSQPTADPADAS